jgi:four helix bundle protein
MGFDAMDIAIKLVRSLRVPVERLRLHDKELADQLKRAVNDLTLALGEAARREGRDRVQFFRTAAGSGSEARAAMDLADAWGYLDASSLTEAREPLDRELAILWRLVHPRRS